MKPNPSITLVLLGFALAAFTEGCGGEPLDNPKDRAYNILLVTVDTLRADHLGAYGYPSIETPNMDRLAAEGALFKRAYTPTPVTLPAHVSIMTGAYPTFHGVRNNGIAYAATSLTTLAEVLKERGYATGAVVAAFVLDSVFGLDQGFDTYDDAIPYGSEADVLAIPERRAEEITRQAHAFLKEQGEQPFFLWVHYFDPHSIYQPPPPYGERYGKSPYDGEIAYVDEQIGALLKMLDVAKHRRNTLVILTADHGEALGDHGEETHGILVYDATLQVPLILSNPELIPKPLEIEAPVSLLDIMPTVLDILNIDGMDGWDGADGSGGADGGSGVGGAFGVDGAGGRTKGMQGTSLVPLLAGRAEKAHELLYFETLLPYFDKGWAGLRGIRSERFKYIDAPAPELYDTRVDPGELDPLTDGMADTAGRLAASLEEMSVRITAGSGEGRALDADTQARLSALGYSSGARHGTIKGDPFRGVDPKSRVWVEAALNRAHQLFHDGRYGEALDALEDLLREEPSNPDILNALAYMCEKMERLQEAEAYYEALLKILPGYARAQNNLAVIYNRQGRKKDAVAAFEKTLELSPDHVDAHFNLGLVYLEAGEGEKAELHWKRVIELQPNFAKAHYNLGSLYANRGDYAAAIPCFEKTVSIDPRFGEAHYNLSKACLLKKDYRKASLHLDRARRLGVMVDPALLRKVRDGVAGDG